MDFSKILKFKSIIATIAPTIATALGGPFAGGAVATISKAILGKENGTEDEIVAQLATHNPDMLLKIKEAEQSFRLKMKELEVDVYKLDATDRDSARKMKIATGGNTQEILAGIFIIGYFVIVYNLFSGAIKVDATNNQLTLIIVSLISIMGASVTQIMNFYFGSSKGSKDKTEALSKAIK